MKRLLITAFVTLAFINTASADYATDIRLDVFYGENYGVNQTASSEDMTKLPATAAGRQDKENMQTDFSRMQDRLNDYRDR